MNDGPHQPDELAGNAAAERRPDRPRRWRPSRRGLLTAGGGAVLGAAAAGGAWSLLGKSAPVVTTTLPTADKLEHHMLWTTLGTAGGPVVDVARAQPANLLHDGEHAAIVDAGDGVVDQLVKAGIALSSVQTVVLSHLHIDHTAGLMGILGRRLQQYITTPLTVYGPPGTGQEVSAVQTALAGLRELVGTGTTAVPTPDFNVMVREVSAGSTFAIGDARVSAAANSHYGFAPNSSEAQRFQSLSYRFDMPDRSLVFTGDTGPSDDVERLARGADVLVSEINDPDAAVAAVRATRPDLPAAAMPFLRRHFDAQHLSASNVGVMAGRAGVGAVVLTHNAIAGPMTSTARQQIDEHFTGPTAFANDLDNW